MPIAALPELETRVAALALRIAGENPSTSGADLARRVAEAQVDLQRVRAAKLLFSNGSIKIAARPTVTRTMAIIRLMSKALDGDVSAYAQIEGQQNPIYSSPEKGTDAEAVLARIADPTRELAKLDSYERRALSRRKFATRDLDATGAGPEREGSRARSLSPSGNHTRDSKTLSSEATFQVAGHARRCPKEWAPLQTPCARRHSSPSPVAPFGRYSQPTKPL